jgi:uncharacterized protein YutE (UPF0331/DUF86 family)
MTPGTIRASVVLEKLAWISGMVDQLQRLPLGSLEEFEADRRNPLAAESCLRRALEGILDLGRHLLSKAFADGVLEYKQVSKHLHERDVISERAAELLHEMAGYRNRLVHYYDEVTSRELYVICTDHLKDIELVRDEILAWLRRNQDRLDNEI